MIATACGDNYIRIFRQSKNGVGDDCSSNADALNFELIESIQAHDQDVNCVKWCPQLPGMSASCSDDGSIKLWQINLDKLKIIPCDFFFVFFFFRASFCKEIISSRITQK